MAANRIAQAYIELRAEGATKTKAAIGAVKKEVETLKKSGDRSLGGLGERMEKSTEGARRFQGAIGGVVGIFAVVAGVFYKLGGLIEKTASGLEDGAKKAERFVEALGDRTLENAPARLEAIRAEQDKLNELLADDSVFGFFEKAFAGGEENVRKQRDELSRLGQLAADQLEARKIREEEAAKRQADVAAEAAKAANEAIRAQNLLNEATQEDSPGERARLQQLSARITATREIADIEKEIEAQRARPDSELAGGIIAALEDRKRLIAEGFHIQIAGIRASADAEIAAAKKAADEQKKLDEERDRREREAAEKRAEAEAALRRSIAEANAEAINDLNQSVSNALNTLTGSQSQTFSRLEDAINRIGGQLARVERNVRR